MWPRSRERSTSALARSIVTVTGAAVMSGRYSGDEGPAMRVPSGDSFSRTNRRMARVDGSLKREAPPRLYRHFHPSLEGSVRGTGHVSVVGVVIDSDVA